MPSNDYYEYSIAYNKSGVGFFSINIIGNGFYIFKITKGKKKIKSNACLEFFSGKYCIKME